MKLYVTLALVGRKKKTTINLGKLTAVSFDKL